MLLYVRLWYFPVCYIMVWYVGMACSGMFGDCRSRYGIVCYGMLYYVMLLCVPLCYDM